MKSKTTALSREIVYINFYFCDNLMLKFVVLASPEKKKKHFPHNHQKQKLKAKLVFQQNITWTPF
jgi:hypothetical protein